VFGQAQSIGLAWFTAPVDDDPASIWKPVELDEGVFERKLGRLVGVANAQ
jgi:hypothetical protein